LGLYSEIEDFESPILIHDGREQAGFFKNTDSCRVCDCAPSKEFGYLSDSSRKVFERFTKGMSWYEYSRHSTAVLVYYLRSYDYLIQKLDENGILEDLPLEKIVEFTNSLFETWPLKESHRGVFHESSQYRLPKLPAQGIFLKKDEINWLVGTENEFSEYEKLLNESNWDESKKLSERIIKEVPYEISTTDSGYLFTLNFQNNKKEIHIDIVNGNMPALKGEFIPELWRAGINLVHPDSVSHLTRGKAELLDEVIRAFPEHLKKLQVLSMCGIPLAERIMYTALDTMFLKKHFKEQLKQARTHINKSIDELL